MTHEPILDGMSEQVVMAEDTLRLGMMSRCMDHVDGNRDDEMRRDAALRDLGPE